jgi:nitroreductase
MVLDAILGRRSVREYTSQPVGDAQIRTLLEAAMAAPSASDLRPWEFIVVRDEQLKRTLAGVHQWAGMAARAPVVFVVCGDERRSDHWVEDTSAATENLLVQAAGMGLGGVWIGIYPRPPREEAVRRALGIPEHVRVLCLVPIGYPVAAPAPRTRYEDRCVHFDRY